MAIEYAISAGEGTLIDYGEAISVDNCDGFAVVLKYGESPQDIAREFHQLIPGMKIVYSQVYNDCETGC